MDGNFVCSLCLDFSSDDPTDFFTTTECGHLFHELCLKPAYEGGHKRCPICRAKINPQNWRKIFGLQTEKKVKPPRAFKELTVSSASSNEPDYDYRFKIVLVGNGHVGKSSIMARFADGIYNTSVFATVACDWRSRTVHVGNKKINLSIWDTAGQERHRSLCLNFVRDAHGALIVYDITDTSSIDDVEMWDNFVSNGCPDTIKILIGNKTDLETERKVSKDKGKALARKLGMSFFETSAKDSYNVESAFRCLCAKILESDTLLESIEARRKNPNVQLSSSDQVMDSAMYTACVNGLQWVKFGFNGTMNGVKSGWKYLTSSSSSNRGSLPNDRSRRT